MHMSKIISTAMVVVSVVLLKIPICIAANEKLPACIQNLDDFGCFQQNR